MTKIKDRVHGNVPLAYIATGVIYRIPRDGSTYTIRVPVANFREDLAYNIDDTNVLLAFNSLDSNGVLIDVTVAPAAALGARDLVIENEMRTIMSDHSSFGDILKDLGKSGYGDTRHYGDYK